MKKLLLPLILALVGGGGGIAAGLALKPDGEGEDLAETCAPLDGDVKPAAAPIPEPSNDTEFVKFNNQFIVPVMSRERVISMIVMSISLETEPALQEEVYAREPKLRDGFLRVLFDHANAGGFSGKFTDAVIMNGLRRDLLSVAHDVVGPKVVDVLITDIARQDS
ncbi:flagellar basal body-associated FliL family protein [Tropicimonas sp. IMCC34011]|uniref:flagellar basal body-associated FliL family protein n=1 Tax=Tropicimonas sp. IMCC34011 TaxID=2248759 RepID=UPI000E21F464|nr:flagellar basal body-associated FliL family protein [Tropicimonas sp. IMCC34011]